MAKIREKANDKIATARKALEHLRALTENMRQNRNEYNTRDLGWRAIDLIAATVEVLVLMLDGSVAKEDADVSNKLESV